MDIQIDRLVHIPARLRKFPGDQLLHPHPRRRRVAFEQKAQSFAAGGFRPFRKLAQAIKGRIGCGVVSAPNEAPRAVGIVQIQNGGLGPSVGAAVAAGKERVALQLDRPAFIRPREQRHGPAARRHGRRIILRGAVNVVFRLFAERLEMFHGPAATAAGQAHPREEE
jgi:hypothetical protein